MALREHPERVVGRIEIAWSEGDLSAISDMIHESAALVPHQGGPTFCGREPFLMAFRRVPHLTFGAVEQGGAWQTWGSTAVFERPVSYLVGAGEPAPLRAREVWVLSKGDNALWSVVWHTTAIRVRALDRTCGRPSPKLD